MAEYSYDESGSMAAYFLLTFLLVVLIPFTLSSVSVFRPKLSKDGCPCQDCVNHRAKLRPGLFSARARKRLVFLSLGWASFGFVVYKVATSKHENKVYNPFEILDIAMGTSVKDIKSHYKKLSRKFHPDKVKLTVNDTMEAIEARFIEITKAYKALTDENIRENWERYGHPDGRQEVSMGIALPKTIVEGRNRNIVLAVYGLIFGGMLPALVGRWWFGNREKTKDGVNARSAAVFFKTLGEDSGMDDVVASLGKSFEYERPKKSTSYTVELNELEKKVEVALGPKWHSLKKLAEISPKESVARRRAFVLIYAHLLRIPIENAALRKEQEEVLLQTPTLLNSLLNIVLSRNWLVPTVAAMRLHAYFTQALLPGDDTVRFAQLPGIKQNEAKELANSVSAIDAVPAALEEKSDGRSTEVKKALSRWGKLDVVDASFKVIGERIVAPLSIVYLIVKLRVTPPTGPTPAKIENGATSSSRSRSEDEFLTSRKDAEDMPQDTTDPGWAHAPYWPANRKPGWWIVLADPKIGKVIVPPMKITDVPLANPQSAKDYRAYKLQFQAPPQPQTFNWKLYLISDTYVGEEITRDIMLRVEEAKDEELAEDEISEPEEDSLAGQMALMRGGSVKKHGEGEEGSDDESSTDDDEKSDDDDSSDSDSD